MSTAYQTELKAQGLPVGQQLVLLFLLRDSLAKKVTPLLQRESGISKPASSDWALLIQKLYIKKGQHWFLTQCGRFQAVRTAKAIAKRHGIHHVSESDNVSGFPLSASCACGWTTNAQRSWNGQARLNAAITGHLARIDRDEVLQAARDIRIEPDAPIDALSEPMRAALLAMVDGPLTRIDPGYARLDDNRKPILPFHAVVTINALADRGLVRRFVLMGTGGREGEAHLTGDGAWVVRTLRNMSK